MTMHIGKSLHLLLFLGMTLLSALFWADNLPAETKQSGSINIEADRMESNQQENIVHFTGNVEARQNDLTIWSDTMTVHYANGAGSSIEKTTPLAQAVDTLISEGNVRIKSGTWTASGDRMEYYEKDRKVILTGNTKVWENNNTVTGERIELFLDEGRSVVEKGGGGEERVKAFFYPDSSAPKDESSEK
jgi:lipopolysaccharide export system protein LptA